MMGLAYIERCKGMRGCMLPLLLHSILHLLELCQLCAAQGTSQELAFALLCEFE